MEEELGKKLGRVDLYKGVLFNLAIVKTSGQSLTQVS